MLINTVVLFLRDALPLFIVLVLLLAVTNKLKMPRYGLYWGLVIGLVITLALLTGINQVAQALDNTGLELLFSGGYLLIYLSIVFALTRVIDAQLGTVLLTEADIKIWTGACLLTMALVCMINGANFMVYITGFWSQSGALMPQLIGTVLGLGICVSMGILLYFLVLYLDQKLSRYSSTTLLLCYGAGQLMHASTLLLQIDWLPAAAPVWDMDHFIKSGSEIGHLFSAFFGYIASPTLSQLLIYAVALLLPGLAIAVLIAKAKPFDKPRRSLR